jgi:hypothetical protein
VRGGKAAGGRGPSGRGSRPELRSSLRRLVAACIDDVPEDAELGIEAFVLCSICGASAADREALIHLPGDACAESAALAGEQR